MITFFFILKCFYLLLPAAFANMAPGNFCWLKVMKQPVDFKKKIAGKRILGNNKTWHGVVFGIISAIIIAFLQSYLYHYSFFEKVSFLDYSNPLMIGLLLGTGAILGDLVESFFKRRLNLKPGQPLILLDQTDWVMGSFIFMLFFYVPDFNTVLVSLILFFILHMIVKRLAFIVGTDSSKW